MATELVPSSIISVEFLPDGETPTVSSKDIALHFQKKHKDVLRDIERIRSMLPADWHGRNFAPMLETVAIGNGATRQDKAYRLTRDAFSLLAMGFTGVAAIRWKLKYIEAFNALEAGLIESVRQAALEEGKRLALPEAMRLHKRLTAERLEQMKRALAYEARGFYHVEIAKMLDCSHDKARKLLRDAHAMGMTAQGAKESRR